LPNESPRRPPERARAFDAAPHIEAAAPVLKLSLWLAAILGAFCIGGGIVAIIWNSVSPTQIRISDVTATTGHVGVAFTALGVITLIIGVRSVNKNLYKLGALPPDRKPRSRWTSSAGCSTKGSCNLSRPVNSRLARPTNRPHNEICALYAERQSSPRGNTR
jgi:hypothetical protein